MKHVKRALAVIGLATVVFGAPVAVTVADEAQECGRQARAQGANYTYSVFAGCKLKPRSTATKITTRFI